MSRSAVRIETVQHGDIQRQVRGTGRLVPKEARWITSQSSGRVERIYLKPGAHVTPSSILMELTNENLMQQYQEAEWALEEARTNQVLLGLDLKNQLLDRKADVAAAKSEYEIVQLRAEAEAMLAEKGGISHITVRQTVLQAEQLKHRYSIERENLKYFEQSIETRLSAEEARVKQQEKVLQRRSEQVENLVIRAGVEGMLQGIPVEEGQQVGIGTTVGNVAKPGDLLAELQIPEIHAQFIRLEQSVTVDTRNGTAKGKVTRIDPAVRNGTVQVDVELIEAPPAGARPDLTVDGVVEIERLSNILHIKRPAYAQADQSMQLFRVDEQTGVANRVTVRIGRTSLRDVEIVDGVQVGNRLIVSDISAWDGIQRLIIE